MPKFYIQSGQIRFVVNAADAEGAALWVLNTTINNSLPDGAIENDPLDSGTVEYLIQGTDCLDPQIHVSEIGFGRCEVAVFETELLFKQWFQLLNAMNHLLDQLEE